jgi:DNA invertase Pin-like site-specific DNA recombinase
VEAICRQYGVAPSTFYAWLSRYETHHTVENLSKAPHRTHGKVTEGIKAAVLKKHREYPRLGCWRLSLFSYEGVSLSHTTIWRILVEARSPKLPPQILYVLTHPHQIWFIDHMHLKTLPSGQKVYSLIVLDGWSRVLVSEEVCFSKGARDACLILIRAFARWGMPEEILSDNYKAFWSLLYRLMLPQENIMKTIAYLRVSKDTQDVNHQKLAILAFAQQQEIRVDEFIELTVSSRKSHKQRKIDTLTQQLDDEDTLIVSELSRIGRSVGEIVTTVDALVKRGIRVLAVKEGIDLHGEQDLSAKVMVTMFSLFAEIERELISLRTKEGLAAARSAGKQLGRPKGVLGRSKLDSRKKEIEQLLSFGVSKSAIARITKVDRTTLYHFIKSRRL